MNPGSRISEMLSSKPSKRGSFAKKLNLKNRSTRTKAIICLSIVSFIWGTTWMVSKEGVIHMPALELAGIRLFVAGLLYLSYFLIRGFKWPSKEHLLPLFALSILNFALSNGLSTWGVKYISSGLGAIIGAIFPLWLAIIGLFMHKERLPQKALIGLLLGFSGICIIFYEYLGDFLNSDFRFGILLSIIATWTWAFGTIYTKSSALKFNPYFGFGFQMLVSGIILFAVSAVQPNFLPLNEIPAISWYAIGYLIVFGSIIGFGCYLYALQNLPTEQASIYAYINPIVALILGALIFQEILTLRLFIGGIVTLVGVYFVNKVFKNQKI